MYVYMAAFLIHRKDLVVVKRESVASYESKKPSGQDAHLADKKLVVNDTARARRISQARFFVLEKLRNSFVEMSDQKR